MAVNLIMLGPPGAGKGTQAEGFAKSRGIPKISTGDALREAVKANTEVGQRAKAIMDRGELVSDDVMIGMVEERLNRSDTRRGFVLDGFPRTVGQAIALDRIMQGRDPLVVIHMVVPDPELIRRLAWRLICADCGETADQVAAESDASAGRSQADASKCRRCGGRLEQRADDNVEVVKERLKVYHRNTQPLVDYYQARPTFRSIDGAQSPDRVAEELASAIAAIGNGGMTNPLGGGAFR